MAGFFQKMQKAARVICALLSVAIAICSSSAFSQDNDTEKKSRIRDEIELEISKWEYRLNFLRDAAFEESMALNGAERALYLANLAKLFWNSDRSFADANLKRASKELLIAIRDFDDKSNGKRLFLIISFEIINKLDRKISQSLIRQILSDAENNGKTEAKGIAGLGEIYALLAKSIARDEPEAALNLANHSLNFGFSDTVPDVIAVAYKKQPRLAETIIKNALVKTRNSFNPDAFRFEKVLGSYLTGKAGDFEFPADFKLLFLYQQYDRVSEAVQDVPDRQIRCQIAWYAAKFVSDFDQNLPILSESFRRNIDTCLKFLPQNLREITRLSISIDENTPPSELISKARNTSDSDLKIRLWRAALTKLEKDGNYSQMISYLDSVDGIEFKDLTPIGWDDWRQEAAFREIEASIFAGDIPAAYRTLGKAPNIIKPKLRIRLLKEIDLAAYKDFSLDNLNQLAREIELLSQSPVEMAQTYVATIQLFLDSQPIEAVSLFGKLLSAIDMRANAITNVSFMR